MYGNIKLYAGSACPELARRVSDYIGIRLNRWDITTFPNENIFIRLNSSVRGQDVYLIQTHDRPVNDNIMEMLIAIDCFKRDSAGRITVVIPYMAYSQSDKKDQPRVPITSRLLADMIEAAGADRWITVDLHAGQIQGFYKIPGDALTAHRIICDYIRQKQLNATVVTTDLGYAKGGRNYAESLGFPLAFVEKRRIGNEAGREALTLIGSVDGRDVLIVDDLVDTAGSVAQAVEIVRAHGAKNVYLA
ncbi:MAG TPA: ribose-phosphate diphosphokinase, partial [Promineifilum sp.]|nr:ribose-phosphate diphosphokinase [Promineifilum sp.]